MKVHYLIKYSKIYNEISIKKIKSLKYLFNNFKNLNFRN